MSKNPIVIEGFVIVQPLSEWDKKFERKIIADLSYSSFGRTEHGAWRRFIGPHEQHEFNIKVQRFHDKGYRLRKARMEIDDTNY